MSNAELNELRQSVCRARSEPWQRPMQAPKVWDAAIASLSILLAE